MKKITRFFLVIAAIVAFGSVFSEVKAAKQYCHEPITAGGKTIYLSCETPSAGNYRITIECDDAMTNLSAGCYCNINGVGGGQLIAQPGYVRSSDGKKITIDIPSSSAPNLYTPLYILFPGEINFGSWPTSNIIWTGTCIPAGIPTVTATTAASSITANSAVCSATISDIGTSAITASGLCWGTATLPTIANSKTTDGPLAAGTITSTITGLSSGVKYYVRPYATNSVGTAYGPEVNFVTLDTENPTSFTATKGTVTTSSVELLLNATDNSGSISYTISYGSTPTVVTTTGVSGTQKSYVVTGLTAGTAYTFSVTAKDASNNSAGAAIDVAATTVSHPVAPVPPARDASTIIGIYSDTYTCVPNTFQWWAATSSVDITTSGNNSKLITSTNCFGTQVTTTQDLTSMKYLHVDIYPTTVTTMQIGVVAPAGNEYHPANTLVANQWNSFDISLADLKAGKPSLDLTKLTQVGFWGMNGSFYLDNIYFWTDVAPTLTVSTSVLSIAQPVSSTNTFGITTSGSWTVASDQTWLTPSSTSGSGNTTITLTASAENATYAARTANVTITGSGSTKTIVVTQAPLMPPAAPTPTFAAAKVISIYSDAYSNVGSPNFFPGWGQSTVATATTLGGNAAMQYTNFNYQGITLNSTDVSSMNKIHVDIFPTTATTVRLTPISHNPGAAELPTSLGTLTANTWNSFDVLLTTYTGVVFTAIDQFKFDGGVGGTFYMDNLYFFNDQTTGLSDVAAANGIICYPNPATDKLFVNAKSDISQVIVRNLLGQTVKSINVNGLTKSIDLNDMTAGNYFVSVKLTNGQSATQKFVKL